MPGRHNHHHHQQQLLLLSLARALKCLIIFKALLLNGQLAKGEGAMSCSANQSSATCPKLNVSSLFPFVSSQACAGSASSFVILGCNSSNTDRPTWPDFVNATVMAFDNPFLRNVSNSTNIPDPGFGSINLTWSDTLVNKSACESLAPLDQISHYLPQSIHLNSFAHSVFQLTPSNVILLFNCTSSTSSPHLLPNSTACTSYKTGCGLHSSNCSQFIPDSKELNLSHAMESSICEKAMFFVIRPLSTPLSRWRPGLIELNWSTTHDPWIVPNLKKCEGCLQTNGSCGYTDYGDFQCYCANNKGFDTNCTAGLEPPANATQNSGSKKGCHNPLCHPGAVASGAVGAVIVIVAFSLFALYYHRKKRKGTFTAIVPFRLSKRSTRQKLFGSSSLIISHLDLDGLTERPVEYQYASIVFATNSFSNFLGEGGFGKVYKGTLGDAKDDVHMQIAVKVLEVRSKHSRKQFFNEVAAIGRIHHVHVVRLLGFCIEENHEMLVYEYVVNGSLDKWLFHCSGSQKRVLLWEQRYAIAVGIAKGLSYLHEECRHRIVHCDIKPQNTLLDEQMCPKIADFGLARLMGREESRVVTLARGTPGYMAPEFWMGWESQLSTKFDVYSYGMVLLELISGQRNFGDGKCFPETAFEAAMGGDFRSIMDVGMGIAKTDDDELDGMQWQQVRTAVLVALWCIQDHPTNRPSMSEVVRYLEGIAAFNEQPPRPTIASTIPISAQQHSYLSNDLHHDITPISGGR